MLRSPTVREDPSGSAVLIKHADGAERQRLRHEAQVIAAAHMAGVVDFIGLDEFDDRCEMRLRYLEAPTLAELPPLSPRDTLALLIELGTTLEELHARGIRHGALRGDHVLVAPSHRPVLCGFGEATGPADDLQHLPGSDLAALAALAASELTRAERTATEAGERHWITEALRACESLTSAATIAPRDGKPLSTWLARLQHLRDTAGRTHPEAIDGVGLARGFGVIAAHDTHGLRERLRAQAPGPEPSDGAGPASSQASRALASTPDRRRIASGAVLAVTLTVAAIAGWRALAGGGPETESTSRLPHLVATTSAAAGASSPSIAPVGPDDSTVHGADLPDPSAPLDASDALLTPVTEGATLLYSTAAVPLPDAEAMVGSSGDLVATGDWDCDGHSTLAVVSSTTGEVEFYGTESGTDGPVVPVRVAHVPRAASSVSRARPEPDAAGGEALQFPCDALVIHYGELNVTLPPHRPAPASAQPPDTAQR
ncbi:hypothetical protein [Candidatus Poriferisodalis sp.]|uniref:hypothetical protein n=1 Tax=Candidatus Poriferisodalis sp. TaxID=3101277 RepID=UPI003B51DBFD